MNTDIVKPAIAGAIGTTCMSLFSIVTSEKKNRQFREHEILSALLKTYNIKKSNRVAIGWAAHYLTGIAFNTVNQNILKKLNAQPNLLNGLLLGAINGAIGITIWKTIFALHPAPPKINLNKYLAHLMLAHLVFGTLSNLSMKGIIKDTPNALSY